MRTGSRQPLLAFETLYNDFPTRHLPTYSFTFPFRHNTVMLVQDYHASSFFVVLWMFSTTHTFHVYVSFLFSFLVLAISGDPIYASWWSCTLQACLMAAACSCASYVPCAEKRGRTQSKHRLLCRGSISECRRRPHPSFFFPVGSHARFASRGMACLWSSVFARSPVFK